MIELHTIKRAAVRTTALALLALLAACGGGRTDAGIAEEASDDASVAKMRTSDTNAFSLQGMAFKARPCSKEGGVCFFTGEQNVAYGSGDKFVIKRVSGPVACSNATFGDPAYGEVKHCYLSAAAVVAAGDTGSPPVSMPANPVSTMPAVDVNAQPTPAEAARFLVQSTFGPNVAEIDKLVRMGYGAWLEEQFATAPMDSHWAYVRRGGPLGCTTCDSHNINTAMETFWMQAVRGPDQLRQRLVFALSELFVISAVNSGLEVDPTAHVGYLDLLSRDAFGNFRTLLEDVAKSPAMGVYLSHMGNVKEDPATGRLPDENFARELMQLFSVGLWELNEDGSRRKGADGNDIATYTQADVMGMAKVMTGWSWSTSWNSGLTGANPSQPYELAFNSPMANYAAYHSTAEKRILRGVVIPAGTSGAESLRIALDTLFNHPNVGPFIGSQLIKRFVTSNPSPAYVQRVTRAFNDNGKGVRGDMKAVIRAVLMDVEARDAAKLTDPTWGKLREPMIRYANFMRAFDVRSAKGNYQIWNLEDTLSSVGQNPVRAPSVFNWFRPDYSPQGAISQRGLVAPEFQITHETTTTGYANFMASTVERQNTWWRDNMASKYGVAPDYLAGDYTAVMGLASNPGALVDRLNLVLMAGQMTPDTRKAIVDAVAATPADSIQRRVVTAVYLIMQSPEFIVQK